MDGRAQPPSPPQLPPSPEDRQEKLARAPHPARAKQEQPSLQVRSHGLVDSSEGGGTFLFAGVCAAATAGAGATLSAATARASMTRSKQYNEFATAALNPLHCLSLLQMLPLDMVRGCVCGSVVLCWLYFVPCEQSAPTSIMLRIKAQ